MTLRKDGRNKSKQIQRLHNEALAAYRSGKSTRAIELFERLLARRDLDPETKLENLFWLACALHSAGRIQRALRVLEPSIRDQTKLEATPTWGYRMLTRAALLEIEQAAPMERIRALIERGTRLARAVKDRGQSRLWLVRGRLHEARGRRGDAIRCVERGLEASTKSDVSFAKTPYYRLLVPRLLELGRLEEARRALDRWRESGDPEGFKLPHIAALESDWRRARGEFELAYDAASLAFEASLRVQDVAGRLAAAHSLLCSALLMGRAERVRSALRVLRAFGRSASLVDRYTAERACFDGWLGLACLEAGQPVFDLEFGRCADVSIGEAADASAAAVALERAAQARERAQQIAIRLDRTYRTRLRRRELQPRIARLDRLTASLEARVASVGVPIQVVRRTVPELMPRPVSEGRALPVEMQSDGSSWWLELPTDGLEKLVQQLNQQSRCWLVAHPAPPRTPFRVDAWWKGRLEGSGRASISSRAGVERLTIQTDSAKPPVWLTRIADRARAMQGLRSFELGETALANGEPKDADAHFEVATILQPRRQTAWDARAKGLLALGRHEEATAACLRALELDSRDPRPWRTLSEIYASQSMDPPAEDAMEQSRVRAEAREKRRASP